MLHSVLWEIGAAVAIEWLVGAGFGWITFHLPAESKLAQTGDGVIAVAATLIAYALCEIAQCYGFLGVFVAAVAIRGAAILASPDRQASPLLRPIRPSGDCRSVNHYAIAGSRGAGAICWTF